MRVCLLTGAAGRLGTEFIVRHADRYAIVAVGHRSPVSAAGTVLTASVDLRDHRAIRAMVATVVDTVGRIDLVVNAAAVSLRRWGDPVGALDRYVDVLTVNIAAAAWVTAAAALAWQQQPEAGRRSVVNVSSVSGHEVYDDEHDLAYPASKAALNMLTFHQAMELERFGVRVNAVAPTSFPRLLPPSRVTDAIVALDEGDATGRILVVEPGGNRWLGEEP